MFVDTQQMIWSEADANVAHFLCLQAGANSMVKGPPGGGKSQTHHQLAKALDYEFLLLLGSNMAPEDMGLPHVFEAEKFFRQIPPYWAQRLGEPGVMILADEFTCIKPAVRAAFQTMFADRVVSGVRIHPSNLMAGACNPPEYAPDASPLEKAMANRFMHFSWKANFKGWCDGMESEDDSFSIGSVPKAPEDWHRERPRVGYMITGYLRKNPGDWNRIPDNDEEEAFPTSRSWKAVRDCMALSYAVDAPSTIIKAIVTAGLGIETQARFFEYLDNLNLADPEEIIEDKVKFVPDPKRIDITACLMAAIITAVRRNYTPQRMERAVAFFINEVSPVARDLVFAQLRSLVEAKKKGDPTYTRETIRLLGDFSKQVPEEVAVKAKEFAKV